MVLFDFVIFSSLLVLSCAYSSRAPPCKDTSPECLKTSIQSALPNFVKPNPDLGLQSLDPFAIEKLVLTLPGDLKMEFRQGTSKGLRNCIVDSARMVEDPIDNLNNTLDLQVHCNLTIKGLYKSSGRLLMFAINGDGISMIKCKNINIQLLAKLGSRMQEDGKKHLEIKEVKSSHSYDGQVYYRMTNLIQGNPILGDLVIEFMNRNWKLVADEFGKPIVDFGITSILKNVKLLFKAVPQEELIGTLKGFNV